MVIQHTYAYNVCAMRKRRAFTLLEVVVTLSVLAICFALTIGVVASLTSIQKSSSNLVSLDNQLNDVDETIKKYVSMVSIDTSEAESYTSPSFSSNKIVFTNNGSDYSLKFENQKIGIYKDDSITIKEHKVDDVKNLTFTYRDEIALLTSEVEIRSTNYKFVYVLRTLL